MPNLNLRKHNHARFLKLFPKISPPALMEHRTCDPHKRIIQEQRPAK